MAFIENIKIVSGNTDLIIKKNIKYKRKCILYYTHLIDAGFNLGGSLKFLNVTNTSLISYVSNLMFLLHLDLIIFDFLKVSKIIETAGYYRGNFRFVHLLKKIVKVNFFNHKYIVHEASNDYNLNFHFKWIPGLLTNFRNVSKKKDFKIPHFGFIGDNDKNSEISNEFLKAHVYYSSCVDSTTYDTFKLCFPIVGNGCSLNAVLFYFSYFLNSILVGNVIRKNEFNLKNRLKIYEKKNLFFKRYLLMQSILKI